jgi:hypothetical protein
MNHPEPGVAMRRRERRATPMPALKIGLIMKLWW